MPGRRLHRGRGPIRTVLEDRLRELLRGGSAATGVDVMTVGFGGDGRDSRTKAFEQLSREARSGAVCRVHHEVEAGQRLARGMAGRKEIEVAVAEGAVDGRQIRACNRRDLLDAALDVALDLVRELFAPGPENLDAVVFSRVVGRRNHDAGGAVVLPEKVRDRGCRQDTRPGHRSADRLEPTL